MLVVEDGTGVAGAESYISAADATTYFAARNNAAWAALDVPTQEAALRAATDYMGATYRLRWLGSRATTTQSLDWPRGGVTIPDAPCGSSATAAYGPVAGYFAGISGLAYQDAPTIPSNVVPQDVVRACAELAVRTIEAPLAPDLGPHVTRETVGPITVEFQPGTRQSRAFQAVDAMLAPYLRAQGALGVVRA